MKKIYLLTLTFSFLGFASMAQDSNILIGLGSPALGVTIKTNFPTGSGAWARGFKISNQDNTASFITLGSFGNFIDGVSSLSYSYIGTDFNKTYMVFLPSGNVGIGTTTPKEKLSVNGNIRAREIKVESANWPDYVFAEAYQPMSLSNLKTFVKEHKHLPGIPSATEVKGEGISLGEMNRKLIEKIEELTLHLIEKDEQLSKQNLLLNDVLQRLEKVERITKQ